MYTNNTNNTAAGSSVYYTWFI